MSEIEDEKKIRGLLPGFASLYATWSNRLLLIYEERGIVEFWSMFKIWVRTLPVKIKDKCWPVIEQVDKNKHNKLRSYVQIDFIATNRTQSNEEIIYLEKHGMAAFDLVQDELDKAGYKIKESDRISLKDFERLERENEDSMDTGQ